MQPTQPEHWTQSEPRDQSQRDNCEPDAATAPQQPEQSQRSRKTPQRNAPRQKKQKPQRKVLHGVEELAPKKMEKLTSRYGIIGLEVKMKTEPTWRMKKACWRLSGGHSVKKVAKSLKVREETLREWLDSGKLDEFKEYTDAVTAGTWNEEDEGRKREIELEMERNIWIDWNRKPRKEKVYLIGSAVGLTKIGSTTNLKKRYISLQSGSPVRLWIIGSMDCYNAQGREKEMHHEFRAKRSHGEWFELDERDIQLLFKKYKFKSPES